MTANASVPSYEIMDIPTTPQLSDSEAAVLQLLFLERGDGLHGLGIVKASNWRIPRGSVYRLLRKMEQKRLVQSRRDDAGKNPGARRRIYRPTDVGEDAFNLWKRTWTYSSANVGGSNST